MSALKPITIIGGGLAGLTLGIGLRQRGVPVTVWEAGHYPRHRVCGEFIRGEGQHTLARLGLNKLLSAAGALPAKTASFFSTRHASAIRELPEPAISISRFALDDLLAKHFQNLGGELRLNERWRDNESAPGTVRATGRRARPVTDGWRWFGLKAHARNVPLASDLEMHFSPSSYIGMNRLPDGEVNVCGLFRRASAATDTPSSWQEFLRGENDSVRHQKLARAEWDEASFCSVAGLSLEPMRAAVSKECCVGDAITMIPPVTGNGMSMAFESAEIAIEPLTAYSYGLVLWSDAQRTIAQTCDERFGRRMAWARQLQQLIFLPRLQSAFVLCAPRWPRLWRLLLEKTR